jgi:hypothetical protein
VAAAPVYWLTSNPYAAFNFVVLFSFVASAVAAYYLVRHLVHDRRAALVSAILFAYTPYIFSHLPHIQLLMTAGLPLSLLAFHRLVATPTWRRGIALGLAMAAQNAFCAYYGVFVMLAIGFGVLFMAASRRLWASAAYWKSVAVAAAVALAASLPLFLPYMRLQQSSGFARTLEAAREYSATWSSYLASAAYAHAWMLAWLQPWGEVLFPGFLALMLGGAGIVCGWLAAGRQRETACFYAAIAALATWLSFGPAGGLYSVLYAALPPFGFMRAPSRFGVLTALALAVLAGFAVSLLLKRVSRPALVAALLVVAAASELAVPLRLPPVPREKPVYQVLSLLPRGAVLELPVFSHRFRFMRTRYMLSSTTHWMPLVNAYSDHIPEAFLDAADTLGGFPTAEALGLLRRDQVRYAVVHLDLFDEERRAAVRERLSEYAAVLTTLYEDDDTVLVEIDDLEPEWNLPTPLTPYLD